jgi:pimeloyl-ACP methyl ester carboxylesterase
LLLLTLIGAICLATVHIAAGFREERARTQYPADGRILDVNGTKVHAEVFGEGPDLILLHGASGSTRDFTFSMVDKLSDRYRVIVFDRPGLGWTRQPEGYGGILKAAGEPPLVQAQLLKAAADQLDVKTPLVLGHSFGGTVAMAWALDNPDTAGVIMVGAVSHPWPGDLDWTYPVNGSVAGGALFVPMITAFVPASYVENVVGSIFAPQQPPDGYIDHVGTGLTLRRSSMRANARQVNQLRPHVVEMSEDYPRLTLPIEIVHGDADETVPLVIHSQPLAERVDSANLTVLPGIGHMPQHSAEDQVIAAIDRAAARAGLR